jgi:Arc/MetJ family transcription regulator
MDHRSMLHSMHICGEPRMRTTINIDEELLAKASKLAGPLDRSALVREGLKAFIERESARRLARLGGTQADLRAAPRRRPAATR